MLSAEVLVERARREMFRARVVASVAELRVAERYELAQPEELHSARAGGTALCAKGELGVREGRRAGCVAPSLECRMINSYLLIDRGS